MDEESQITRYVDLIDVQRHGEKNEVSTDAFSFLSYSQGPILAIATAASALLERRALDVDLVMLIEGEEEAGSDGFHEAVRRNKVRRSLLFPSSSLPFFSLG